MKYSILLLNCLLLMAAPAGHVHATESNEVPELQEPAPEGDLSSFQPLIIPARDISTWSPERRAERVVNCEHSPLRLALPAGMKAFWASGSFKMYQDGTHGTVAYHNGRYTSGIVSDTGSILSLITLRNQNLGHTIGSVYRVEVAGYPGLGFTQTIDNSWQSDAGQQHGFTWVYHQDGFSYEIGVSGANDAQTALKLFKDYAQGFVIDGEDAEVFLHYRDGLSGVSWRWPNHGWQIEDESLVLGHNFHRSFLNQYGTRLSYALVPVGEEELSPAEVEKLLMTLQGYDNPDMIDERQRMGQRHIAHFQAAEHVQQHWFLSHEQRDGYLHLFIGRASHPEQRQTLASISPQITSKDKPLLTGHDAVRSAWIQVQLGEQALNDRRIKTAERWYRRAMRQVPSNDHIPTYLLYMLDSFDASQSLLNETEALIDRFPQNQTMRAYHILALLGNRRFDEVIPLAQSLVNQHFFDPNLNRRIIEAFLDEQLHAQLVPYLQTIARKSEANSMVREAAVALARSGHQREAVLISERLYNHLSQREVLNHRIDLARSGGDDDRAQMLLEQALELWADDPQFWYQQGLLHFTARRYPEARQALQKGLRLDPLNSEMQTLLLHTRSLLSEGSQLGIQEDISPVPLPPEVTMPQGLGTPRGGYALRHRSRALRFTSNVALRSTERLVYAVYDHHGMQELSRLSVDYDPLRENICVNQLQVRDAAGAVLWQGRPSHYYQIDRAAEVGQDYGKSVILPIEGLRPGVLIELTVTRERHHAPAEFPFEHWTPLSGRPVDEAWLWIEGDSNSVHASHGPEVNFNQHPEGRLYQIGALPSIRGESFLGNAATAMTMVTLGSVHRSWRDLAKEYLEDIADHLIAPDDLPFFAGYEDDLAGAIRRVQEEITYHAIAFGDRGYIPQNIAIIQESRQGDCKDHSLLLYHYLRQQGIAARLALVSKWDHIVDDMPSLQQFDHMVVVRPTDDGWEIIDATSKQPPLLLRGSEALQGRYCLVLDDEDPHLFQIDDRRLQQSLQRQSTISVHNNGDLQVVDQLLLQGSLADSWRGFLQAMAEIEREAFLQQYFSNPRYELTHISVDQLEAYDQDLLFQLGYRIQEQLLPDGQGGLLGRLGNTFAGHLFQVQAEPQRRFPFVLRQDLHYAWKIELIAPPGLSWQTDSDSLPTQDDPWHSLQTEAQVVEDRLLLRGYCQRPRGTHPAADYDDFRQSAQALQRSLQFSLRLHSTP